jgi:hypothetical protein
MIYFLRDASGRRIKIGHTARLAERRKAIESERGTILDVLGIMDGGFDEEQRIHARFHHLRLERGRNCEWFSPGGDLLAFIANEARPWQPSDDSPQMSQLRNVIILRGTDEWKDWLDELTGLNHAPLTVTIEQALALLGDRLKHRRMPKRIP